MGQISSETNVALGDPAAAWGLPLWRKRSSPGRLLEQTESPHLGVPGGQEPGGTKPGACRAQRGPEGGSRHSASFLQGQRGCPAFPWFGPNTPMVRMTHAGGLEAGRKAGLSRLPGLDSDWATR